MQTVKRRNRPTGQGRRHYTLIVALIGFAAILTSVFYLAERFALSAETRRAQDRISLYRSTLVSALEEHQHLPFILARDPLVIAAAESANGSALNTRLESFSKEAGVDAIYLMISDGMTIAASNWSEEQTFIGNNYGFRPYFKSALAGARGLFFAIGATTQEPGFFVAEPVLAVDGRIAGVIALKVDLTPLTMAWREGGETLLASDARGVAILASNPDWTYRSLAPLSTEVRKEIAAERQFGSEPLQPLDFVEELDGVRIDGIHYLHTVSDVGHLDWDLHYLTPYSRITQQAWQAVLLAAAALLLASVAILLVRTQRIRTALFVSQEDRRGLQVLNKKLADEIEERKSAERRLERAQKELQQVSKMAALGQLSASVTHELGQPIAAMRNYLAVAELPDSGIDGEARELVEQLNGIAARMEHITGQLRFFAQAEPKPLDQFDLRTVVESVAGLIQSDLVARNIDYRVDIPDQAVPVFGDVFRIEQVLVNMLRNASDAVADTDQPKITLRLHMEGGVANLSVEDNGPGLTQEALTQAEDPFFTTKASGTGMGLGLSISAAILKDHGGKMMFVNGPGGGAVFTMTLPIHETELT